MDSLRKSRCDEKFCFPDLLMLCCDVQAQPKAGELKIPPRFLNRPREKSDVDSVKITVPENGQRTKPSHSMAFVRFKRTSKPVAIYSTVARVVGSRAAAEPLPLFQRARGCRCEHSTSVAWIVPPNMICKETVSFSPDKPKTARRCSKFPNNRGLCRTFKNKAWT